MDQSPQIFPIQNRKSNTLCRILHLLWQIVHDGPNLFSFIFLQFQWVQPSNRRSMFPSQPQHSVHNYHLLQAGLNRIRFLQKRQTSNHNAIAEHLNKIVGRLSQQKTQGQGEGGRRSAENGKQNGFGSDGGAREGMARVNTSRKKLMMYARPGKYAMQTTQEDSSLLKTTQDFDDSLPNQQSGLLPSSPIPPKTAQNNNRLKAVLEERSGNYRQMKQREQQMDLIRRLRSQQSQRALRQRVVQAAARRQQGRRKIEDRYFEYIDTVHQEKDRQRQRRNRTTEKKIEQMLKLQLQEKAKIQQFQSSLVLEEHLRSFLKEKIPLKTASHCEKQSFFS